MSESQKNHTFTQQAGNLSAFLYSTQRKQLFTLWSANDLLSLQKGGHLIIFPMLQHTVFYLSPPAFAFLACIREHSASPVIDDNSKIVEPYVWAYIPEYIFPHAKSRKNLR